MTKKPIVFHRRVIVFVEPFSLTGTLSATQLACFIFTMALKGQN